MAVMSGILDPVRQGGGGAPDDLFAPELIEFRRVTMPAQGRHLAGLRRELRCWLAAFALTDDGVSALILAVNEAATNVIEHAYAPTESGIVELAFWTEPGAVCIEVCDRGHWRPRPPGHLTDGGRGIPLMRSCADVVLIDHDRRGTRVYIRQALSSYARKPAAPHGGHALVAQPQPVQSPTAVLLQAAT
ncbi:MAG: ATP-binding protein [Pseudonocardiaceae bacterium]